MADIASGVEYRLGLVNYTKAQSVLHEHPLRSHEVPLEDYLSLAVPTHRWATPAWAWFSCPSKHGQGGIELGPPDRVWAFAAHGGALVVYAAGEQARQWLAEASAPAEPVPPIAETIPEIKQRLHQFAATLDELGGLFFSGRQATTQQRETARQVVNQALPPVLVPIYHKLAPDFFSWLSSPG